jgi:hypothetical protein
MACNQFQERPAMNILDRRLAKLEARHPSDDCVTIYYWVSGEISVLNEGDNTVIRESGETQLHFVERAIRELTKTASQFPRHIFALRNTDEVADHPKEKRYAFSFRLIDDEPKVGK